MARRTHHVRGVIGRLGIESLGQDLWLWPAAAWCGVIAPRAFERNGEQGITMNSTIKDLEQIQEKIDGYVRGCQTGDEATFKAAFHPDARMFGALGPERHDVAIFDGLSSAVAAQPGGPYTARVVSVDAAGDAACVKLVESGFWGQDFTNYFLLSRIDGEWQIVAKAFDHSGETNAQT
jgi:Putative lumazine-binding